jgi:hypothetical protein
MPCSSVDRYRYLGETENEGKRSLKILISLSLTTRRHIPQVHSYCREKVKPHMVQFICLMCLKFLRIVLVLVFQTFPYDGAECEPFQVLFSTGDMGWKTKKHSSFPSMYVNNNAVTSRLVRSL